MRSPAATLALISLVCLAACGGGDTTQPTQPTGPKIDPTKPTSIVVAAGDGQTARIKSVLPTSPSFRVSNATGAALGGVSVTFAVTAGGGTLAATTGVTGGDGTVALPTWTLGSAVGANAVTASVAGVAPASLSASGRLPYWTVMVYMAADNNLAAYGAVNLAQMASAGVNPEVQVVVQAEFNPQAFAQFGLSPADVDRPNYDTFRYMMDGSVPKPPNHLLIGPTTDIGNVNMTDPAQLRAFVQWAQQAAPSQHTVLVLWNHGGDAQGLISDYTSAGQDASMSLSQLNSALSGLPTLDVLDFEMCLMGGYEPLSAVKSLAQTVVASEEEEIVNGWDFGRFLQVLYGNPTAAAASVATGLADTFDAAYAGTSFTETVSAYNMSGFAGVDAAVSQLGSALSNLPASLTSAIAGTAAQAQRYGDPSVVDLVDLTDSVRAHTADPATLAAATAVRQAVTASSFLLATHSRNGVGYNARNVSRSHGLQIVMPANIATGLPSSGRGSLTSYAQQFPTAPWTHFLQQWVPSVQSFKPFLDVGLNTTTIWQVWDSAFVTKGHAHLILIEPDGSVSGPAFGTISPSGQFSADATTLRTYYEGWASKRFVQAGTFYFLAWLESDPTNYRPLVNVAYETGTGPLESLYNAATYPRLSMSRSFFADPSATGARVLSNYYTDLQVIASWTVTASSGSTIPETNNGTVGASGLLTAKQIDALRRVSIAASLPANDGALSSPVAARPTVSRVGLDGIRPSPRQ